MSYLDKKNIKFEDERLNCCIDTIAIAVGARKKLNFLIDNLNDLGIEAINSKQYIKNVPVKNGFKLLTCVTNFSDPSYLNTTQIIELSKNDIVYSYEFKLSYFHDLCWIGDDIGSYHVSKVVNESDEYKEEEIKGSRVFYSLINKEDVSLLRGEGIYSIKNEKQWFPLRVSAYLDDLLADKRELLKDREFYRALDKETIRLYYPSFYEYYNTCNGKLFYDFQTDLSDIDDSNFDNRNTRDGSFEDRVSYMHMCGREIYYDYLKNYVSYDSYCKMEGLSEEISIDYHDWVKVKENIKKVDIEKIESIPVFGEIKEEVIIPVYNPNKFRYEDDEELVSNKKNKC